MEGGLTDKIKHGYLPFYKTIFKEKEIKSVLEIGVQKGYSILLWREMLPDAKIVGVDINEPPVSGCICADATKAFPGMEGPWDLIIDDGSHLYKDIVASFKLLWPYLNKGGYYVIEDVPRELKKEVPSRDMFTIIKKT